MRRCCALVCLLALTASAKPIVLKTMRHTADLSAHHKRDMLEHTNYPESLVNDLETYAVEIGLGEPTKNYRVVIDSASADLLVYSTACPKANCPGTSVSSSSSANAACAKPLTCKNCRASDNTCQFSQSFGDGSSCAGNVVEDTLTFDVLKADVPVGMINAASGGAGNAAFFANSSVSGIFGLLNAPSTSNYGAKSPIWALVEQNNLPRALTMCLRPAGGALILGEEYEHTATNYQWTPMTSRTLFTVKINDIGIPAQKISGGHIAFSDNAAVLDSATTNFIFPAASKDQIQGVFKNLCKRLKMKGICDESPSIWTNYVQLTNRERVKFPNIVFYIDGLERALAVSPRQYLTEYNGYYIMNIDFKGTTTILGNGFMKNFRIAVDIDNHKIGFGDMRTCPGGPTPPKKTDEDTYRIIANSSFTGFKFADAASVRYASMCGGTAPTAHCITTDANCAAAGATKPLWESECNYNSALGNGIEVEARFGQPADRADGQAVLGTRDIAMPAELPADKPFLFATLKFFNPLVAASTAPYQVTMRTTVDFTTPHGVDNYAAFSFNVDFNVTNYGTCAGKGCPWNDDASWPNHLMNKKCVKGKLPDGTACCPVWTTENANNQCASLVELGSLYDVNMRAAELNGELFKIFFIGFHEDSKEHRSDRRLYEFFSADVGTITAANLHARLTPMCPECPPGTTQQVHVDGSCTCQCATSCELPAVGEPDCSCVERISHDAACNYFCDEGDYASVACTNGGTLYVVAGSYRGTTLPPTPPGCDYYSSGYAYDDYYGYDSSYGSCGGYDDMHCECVCPSGCGAGAIQNADCTCACGGCPENKYVGDNCACLCRDGCPGGMVQNADSCGCFCASGCPDGKLQTGDCSCTCPGGCPAGQVQNYDSCGCSCPAGCPAGQVQDENCNCACPAGCPDGKIQNGDCTCSCASGCSGGQIQDASSCSCGCPSGCDAGMVQDPVSCACACDGDCPGATVRTSGCSCGCPSGCSAGMTQDGSSCGCSCSAGCAAGMVQNGDCSCSCASGCSSPLVQNSDCSCSCPSSCAAGLVQDPTSCHCSCGNTCSAPKLKLDPSTCSCECPSSCTAPRTQDGSCACVCPIACGTGMIQNADTCECTATCTLTGCPAGKSLNADACSCDCAAGCPAGKVQDPNSCSCLCASGCTSTALVQDPSSCSCACPFTCPAGQVQDLSTCGCDCPTNCPAHQVRNAGDCGCHCGTSCEGPRNTQDPSTCICTCPTGCPAGQIQDAENCACSCPSVCPAGQTRDASGCGCHCEAACARGMVQDLTSCSCGCPTTCTAGQVQDTDCTCKCPNACAAGFVQHVEDCDCHCANTCGTSKIQDSETCACSCATACPAGQSQDPNSCACFCPEACSEGQVRAESACGCKCEAVCVGAASYQDPDTCTCMCPNECKSGETQNAATCACACPNKCAAGQARNSDDCGCHCKPTCSKPMTEQNPTTCACGCPDVKCPAGFTVDAATCGCGCATSCPTGQILNVEMCSCSCASKCSGDQVQATSCECSCAFECGAGMIRNSETDCGCHCESACPAGQVRNSETECGCHCPNTCTEPASHLDATTCGCSCPNPCSHPFTQDANTCVCSCGNTCTAPMVLDASNCHCGCPTQCPAGKIQSNTDCSCTCANMCNDDEDRDEETCECTARAVAKKSNKGAIIGGSIAGAVALLALGAAALWAIRARSSPPEHYRALGDDNSINTLVDNPAFRDTGMAVNNPAFRAD